jgi:hypothetical protein
MDPLSLIGSILGAGGSIAGSLMGADAQSETAESNQAINIMNFMLRQAERRDRIRAAEQGRDMQLEGATDAQGNRTRYVPGKGWIIDKSATSQELGDLQNREQAATLAGDLPTKRRALERNVGRQIEEGDVADSILRQFQDVRVDPESIKREMLGMTMRGINSDYDNLTNSAMRKAIRTGSSNTGDILADLGRARADSVGKAYGDIVPKAAAQATALEGQQKSSLANLYNMFAQRSSNTPNVSFSPQNLDGGMNNLMSSFAGRSDNGQNQLIAALGANGGSLDYSEPNMGGANAMSTIGQSLGSIFSTQGARNDKLEAYENFAKRFERGSGGF